jgi:predicted AAA+ superfamily ATPase
LIVWGSSSFDIKKKFKDTLVGRTVNFKIFPLDFEEFLTFKQKPIQIQHAIMDSLAESELQSLYIEYLLFGGYPKIVLAETIEQKETYIQQIIDTYVKKDIRDIGGIQHVEKFNKLIQVLANQSGQMLNVAELSNSSKLAKQTVEDYLFLLENTYILKLVPPFFKNIRSELFKTPKIFFYDTGILSMLVNKGFSRHISRSLLETGLFSDLVKNRGRSSVYYWRTQDKKEIDFVLPFRDQLFSIETKTNSAQFSFTALRYFRSHYPNTHPLCVHLEGECRQSVSGIIFLKPWELFRSDQILAMAL